MLKIERNILKQMSRRRIALFIALITFIFSCVLAYFGILWPTKILSNNYTIHGIDISNHQGKIDWSKVETSGNKFVYIKATEGVDFVDPNFHDNWIGASKTNLFRGAYHYFSQKSSGKEQANNFINTVPVEKGCLPPVLDIEEMGFDKKEYQKQLLDYIKIIEHTYNQKPILYVTNRIFKEYIEGYFEDYPIWIRDIIVPPNLTIDHKWLIWQYYDRGAISGIDTFVDFNVFNGKIEDLKNLLSQ